MNLFELLQRNFGPAEAARLGREVGLDAAEAGRVLREGLPLYLAALAAHARTGEGPGQIDGAMENLPRFASVEAALRGPDAATTLQRAGELLGPSLLGAQDEAIAARVGGTSHPAEVQGLLHLALPLLLSFLHGRGVGAGDLLLLGAGPGETAAPAGPPPRASARPVVNLSMGGGVPAAAGGEAAPRGDLTAPALVEFLRAQLGGETAVRLGALAGFGDASAARATQAAWPVVLGAVAHRGRTTAGAGVLLNHSHDFERVVAVGGGLSTPLLDDPAQVARVEGQGRGLLGSLFGDVDRVRGRLGAALGGSSAPGGSGESAGRLLALLAPLVLGLVLGRARAAGLNADRLSTLLAGLGAHLPGLLPSELSGLGALLTRETVVVRAVPEVVTPAPRRRPGTPPPPISTQTVTPLDEPERRWRLGWWVPLLLVLVLGGIYLLRRPPSRPLAPGTVGASGARVTVAQPAPGANLPPDPFTLSGRGRPGDALTVEDDGLEVASAQVRADGTWRATLPAPTLGEHIYRVRGSDGAGSGEFRINVTTSDAEAPAPTPQAAFALTAPAPGARLPAGSLTLRGTGLPGERVQVLEDGTSLGSVVVGGDGTWSLDVPSPGAGPHTYALYAQDSTELGRVEVTVAAFGSGGGAVVCDGGYTLSITGGQSVRQPFRFGGLGEGEGYRITVRRGPRVVGTRTVRLDPTCGWSYQSRPGAGAVTYEVRPLNVPRAEPLSVVELTVQP